LLGNELQLVIFSLVIANAILKFIFKNGSEQGVQVIIQSLNYAKYCFFKNSLSVFFTIVAIFGDRNLTLSIKSR